MKALLIDLLNYVMFLHVPLHIDVTHLLSSDAGFIQNDISGVPNDDTQLMSGGKEWNND